MQSKPKGNSIITSRIADEADILAVTVRLPRTMVFTVLDEGDVTFDLSRVHPDNLGRAIVHGFNQRIPDAAAIGVTDDEGNVIPKSERNALKHARMLALAAHYESGTADWSRNGGGGGSRSLTIEALAEVKDWTYETAEEEVQKAADKHHDGDRKPVLAKLRKAADVSAAMTRIRNRREQSRALDVNADDILNG